MIIKEDKNLARLKRHKRVRKNVFGTSERPRLNVFRSANHIYAQVVVDETGATLISASTIDPELKGKVEKGGNVAAAKLVGQLVAKRALEKGIEQVVFDRGGYLYHGRVAALAEGAREAGLKF
ncbi:MAG: 50S ribosomal protein L18 [Actinobacteria bacterium]|nr:50S ribosomal protein L18 [Actinomycetota bacterium]